MQEEGDDRDREREPGVGTLIPPADHEQRPPATYARHRPGVRTLGARRVPGSGGRPDQEPSGRAGQEGREGTDLYIYVQMHGPAMHVDAGAVQLLYPYGCTCPDAS